MLALTGCGADAHRYGPVCVLLVSPDAKDHEGLGRALVNGGCELVSAYNVEQALAAMQRQEFGVIVADEHLPGGRWCDLFRAKRVTTGRDAYTSIIVILTGADGARMADTLSMGALDTVVRPVDKDILLRAVTVAFARVMRARERRKARLSNPGMFRVSSAGK